MPPDSIAGYNEMEFTHLGVADRIVKYFEENGKKSERLGKFIDRVGFDEFRNIVLG